MPLERIIGDSERERMFGTVIQASFPKLNIEHQRLLHKYVVALLEYIGICFDFHDDIDNFRIKLSQNSYKDCRWILTYLLPYINTDVKSYEDLTDLNELYTLRNEDAEPPIPNSVRVLLQKDKTVDIGKLDSVNYTSPKYVFSNLQYGRFDRSGSSYKAVKFDSDHIRQNYYLLLDTIKTVRNKMHVNWIDIVPYRLDDYEESELYKSTKRSLEEKTLSDWDPIEDYGLESSDDTDYLQSFVGKISGLGVDDIYNTLSVDLYESIIQYKWLIFDTGIIRDGDLMAVPVFYLVTSMFRAAQMLNGDRFIELNEEFQQHFKDQFDRLKLIYEKSGSWQMGSDDATYTVEPQAVETMINGFVMFYDQKYSKIFGKKGDTSGYVKLPANIKEENIDDYDQTKNYDRIVINNTLSSIKPDSAYDFIMESLLGLKNTWYGYKLLTNDRTQQKIHSAFDMTGYNYYYADENPGYWITLKNIYNFAKSAVHHSKTRKGEIEYVRFPRLWSGLDDSTKAEFIKRITGQYADHKSWFNIYQNILHVTRSFNPDYNNPSEIYQVMGKIYEKIDNDIVDIVFESLIIRGTLSKMVAINELTSGAMYDISKGEDKRELVSRISDLYFGTESKFMTNSYYYLTDTPYETVGPFKTDIDGIIDDWDYRKVNSNDETAWYLATVFHWVAQLGFCHKFVHNRVNYITGATGAGKSTQIPKLYTYYLKSVDRVDDASVIVTVPRTNVAESVSSWISREMSLPYEGLDEDGQKITYDNYAVQYKHRRERHTKEGRFPKIKFITDGSVINDVLDPLLRSKRTSNDNKSFIYGRQEKAHVIIVDEAHEHNANMDVILSLAKNAAFYNNKFRLVIMSATMDEDEPTYRRFYRDINDNRKFPLNMWIAKHGLDRIYTERRFHISPPDVGTRFKIDEYYRPAADPVELVKEIVANSGTGDILVFQPGTAEISRTVQELNAPGVLPRDVIAIPYHARLPRPKQSIMKDIHKVLPDLRLSKSSDFATADIYSGENKYKRAIIVSTNISEASITYKSMIYVVDTGIEKTAMFDYRTRTVILKANNITEASRLQRKGRVGRSAPGIVYYTYDEGVMVPNRKQFNISVQDSHLAIYLQLLRDKTDSPIFTPLANFMVSGDLGSIMDPQSMSFDSMTNALTKSYGTSYDKKFIESVIEILMEMYAPNDVYYSYVGEEFARVNGQYVQNSYPYNVYFSGFDSDQLTDTQGKFYIVHPDELSFERNINGDPVSADNNVVTLRTKIDGVIQSKPEILRQMMRSNKSRAFWSTLVDAKLCAISNNMIIKNPYGSIIQYGMSKLVELENPYYAKALIISYGLCKTKHQFNQILNILCYLVVTDGAVTSMFEPDPILVNRYKQLSKQRGFEMTPPKRDVISRTKSMFQMDKSGRTREIADNTDEKLENRESDYAIVSNVAYLIESLIKLTTKLASIDEFKEHAHAVETATGITDMARLIEGDASIIGGDEANLEFRNDIVDNMIDNYSSYQAYMLSYKHTKTDILRRVGLNISALISYIKLRNKVRNSFDNMVKNVDGFTRRATEFETIDDIKNIIGDTVPNVDSESSVMTIFKNVMLLTYPYSVVRKIVGASHHYVSAHSPSLNAMYVPQSVSRNYYHPDSYVDPMYLHEYVHYMSSNTESWSILGLMRITIDDMRILSNVYSIVSSQEYQIDLSQKTIKEYTDARHEKRYGSEAMGADRKDIIETDAYKAISHVKETVDKIKGELRSFGPYEGNQLDDVVFR